LLEQQLVIED